MSASISTVDLDEEIAGLYALYGKAYTEADESENIKIFPIKGSDEFVIVTSSKKHRTKSAE